MRKVKFRKYYNDRIILKENHCEYDDGTVDKMWDLEIDGDWTIGAIGKLYDQNFYQLVLTTFGGGLNKKPKHYKRFKDIYLDGKNQYKTIKNLINDIIKYL